LTTDCTDYTELDGNDGIYRGLMVSTQRILCTLWLKIWGFEPSTTDCTEYTESWRLVRDSFDTKACILEVEKERSLEPCDIEVTEHLREVRIVERCDNLGVHNDKSLNN